MPYFGKRKMCDIHSKEVIAWQNEICLLYTSFSSVYALTPWGLPQLVQTNFTIKDKKTVYVSSIVLSIWPVSYTHLG